jgi:hypothetical protein
MGLRGGVARLSPFTTSTPTGSVPQRLTQLGDDGALARAERAYFTALLNEISEQDDSDPIGGSFPTTTCSL